MTRAVVERNLKDANGDIGDHLRNHIHLTNCIHLKNHIHKHSPLSYNYDRSLIRDLLVLQRSRSLRDPSASPPLWRSPVPLQMVARRMSTGVDHRVPTRIPKGSLPNETVSASNANIDETNNDVNGNEFSQENDVPKTLSEQLSRVPGDGEDVASSNIHLHEQPEPSGRCVGLNRGKRHKYRKMKRGQAFVATKDTRAVNVPSVASNSSIRASGGHHHPFRIDEQEDDCRENNVTRTTRNGCGIPWNWSRIHHRGKSLFDMAGRSFACGVSDLRSKRGESMSQGGEVVGLHNASNGSCSCSKSDDELLPLLVDGYGSQETSENAAWEHHYSGELGIYANSLLNHEIESDVVSKLRSRAHHKLTGNRHGMHQSLTQKYMPRSFRDLVGQNLAVQALSNAVIRRKMGLLYVFHGPHGTGKTSCARILARALICQSHEHPKPCGSCSSCNTHDMGKSTSIKEVAPVSNLDFQSIMDLLDSKTMISQQGSHYRVFIFDDCDTLSADCWSAISKVTDRAPRGVVFMLICSSLDILPHTIMSRCHKFFFPKLKDADIVYALQWISTKEGLEIDKDALKLIATRSDGSLRDAEMTLDQLSLLGQRISVTLVQELAGLISDEKLVDLLDFALSADTVNTVKNLRDLVETGVEPLALMSQLATVITDILGGSYDFVKGRHRRKFFNKPSLAKEDMEKLRQALKIMSELEKQLRVSNDKLTWLTAALLQLAPDRQYMSPRSSADASIHHRPLILNDKGGGGGREVARKSDVGPTMISYGRSLDNRNERLRGGNSGDAHGVSKFNASSVDKRKHVSSRIAGANTDNSIVKGHTEIDEIWSDVLHNIQISCIKEFLYQEGKLISVSYDAAPTVKVGFSSYQTKSKAEKLRPYVVQAFESALGCPVLVEMRSESGKDVAPGANVPVILHTFEAENCVPLDNGLKHRRSEIVEVASTPREADNRNPQVSKVVVGASQKLSAIASQSWEQNECRSIVRSKVSLAHVIQQTEGSANHTSWTKRKAVSIAEKLEQDNLRLESRTRSLLCLKVSRAARRKFSLLKIRTRRSRTLLKLVSCGRCMSSKSPR